MGEVQKLNSCFCIFLCQQSMATEVANGNSAVTAEASVEKAASQIKSFVPYLCVESPKAAEALEWYKDVFGFEVVYKTFHEKRKAEQEEPLVMHAHLKLGNMELMLSDDIGGDRYLRPPSQLKGTTLTLLLICDDTDTLFSAALKKGATSTLELADQSWGRRYGKFQDPFGFEWALDGPLKNASTADGEGAEVAADEAAKTDAVAV